MTTQSALQYSFYIHPVTHIHTVHLLAALLLFYEAQFGVQHLAQGHFGMQIFWEDWGSNCFRLKDDHSTPSATAASIAVVEVG